jgi:hypothetical protein
VLLSNGRQTRQIGPSLFVQLTRLHACTEQILLPNRAFNYRPLRSSVKEADHECISDSSV